ncbi:hypothetical protein D3C87_1750850 [compost metagenome]|jgi:hypothetical protein
MSSVAEPPSAGAGAASVAGDAGGEGAIPTWFGATSARGAAHPHRSKQLNKMPGFIRFETLMEPFFMGNSRIW